MKRGGGNQPVSGAYRAPCSLRAGGEFSPTAADVTVNGEDPIAVVPFQGVEPACQAAFSRTFRQEGNALEDFADGYDAYEEFFFMKICHGAANPRMALGVAQFRKHAGIEQNLHSLTFRIGDRSRFRSSPWRLGPLPSRNCLKLTLLPVSFS